MRWWRWVSAMELRKILAYRSDFWVTFLGQALVQLLIARSLWASIFEARGVTDINGYTLPLMTLYYLTVPIGTKILTGENVGFISRELYDGTFSRYLIYPLSAFQYKTVTYLTHSLFYAVQLVLIYSLYQICFGEFSPALLMNLLLGVGLYLVGAVVYLYMAVSVELSALWVDNVWNLMVIVRFTTNFLGGGFIPLVFFPEASRAILTYTPFPYLASLPVRTILGFTTPEEILQGVLIQCAWAMFFFFLSQLIWRLGQKRFTGVGI